tara:strand:+ start:1448 stop:1564 length:117 start_codon:yes stop_codon:yes gene_type:complete
MEREKKFISIEKKYEYSLSFPKIIFTTNASKTHQYSKL